MAFTKKTQQEPNDSEQSGTQADPRFPSYNSKEASQHTRISNPVKKYYDEDEEEDAGIESYQQQSPQQERPSGPYLSYCLKQARGDFAAVCFLLPVTIVSGIFCGIYMLNSVLSGFRDLFQLLAIGGGFVFILLLFGRAISGIGDKTDAYGGISVVLYKIGNFIYILALYVLFAAIVVAVVAAMFLYLVDNTEVIKDPEGSNGITNGILNGQTRETFEQARLWLYAAAEKLGRC